MNVTFILPAVGRKKHGSYVKTWQMEPLAICVLAALTPSNVDRVFYDDRLEAIPFDEPTDLVALSVETYTARRAYQIAREYRQRGIPVVMGGFHPTLVPDEVVKYADALVTGDAEPVWQQLLEDVEHNKLKQRYDGGQQASLANIPIDRSILDGKRYANLQLVESARGCRYDCEFCSVTSFFRATYRPRPVEDVISELQILKSKNIFFVDDNLCGDRNRLRELLRRMIEEELNIRWFSQLSLEVAQDPELVELLKQSGCICVLIGFESLSPENLNAMGKRVNGGGVAYETSIACLRDAGISVYGTFVFGYDHDCDDSFKQTLEFAVRNKLFFAAFNHLVPFPGTQVYQRFVDEGRVTEGWWLSPEYRFGEVAFKPAQMTAAELEDACFSHRQKFYRADSIIKRGWDRKANCNSWLKAFVFYTYNFLSGREVHQRQMLPLGLPGEPIK